MLPVTRTYIPCLLAFYWLLAVFHMHSYAQSESFSKELEGISIEGRVSYSYDIVSPEFRELRGGKLDISTLTEPLNTSISLHINDCQLSDSLYNAVIDRIIKQDPPVIFSLEDETSQELIYAFKGGSPGPYSVGISLQLTLVPKKADAELERLNTTIDLKLPFLLINSKAVVEEVPDSALLDTKEEILPETVPPDPNANVTELEKVTSDKEKKIEERKSKREEPKVKEPTNRADADADDKAILDREKVPDAKEITSSESNNPPKPVRPSLAEDSLDRSLIDLGDGGESSLAEEESGFGKIWQDNFWLLLAALGLILFILIILFSSGKKKVKVQPQTRNQSIQVMNHRPPPVSQMKVKPRSSLDTGVGEQSTSEELPIREEVLGKGNHPEFIAGLASSPKHLCLSMDDFWLDTSIGKVYIHEQAAFAMEDFLNAQISGEFEEDSKGIPEIGGFFLGKYALIEAENQFAISLEEFVPITPEEHGKYTLEFGLEAYEALANAQDAYEDQETLAWFHTHPGHGLFLSQADLKIHQGFFKKRYQVAIEIDTLTPERDMAIFTRQRSGMINNSRQKKMDSPWIQWNQLKKNFNALGT